MREPPWRFTISSGFTIRRLATSPPAPIRDLGAVSYPPKSKASSKVEREPAGPVDLVAVVNHIKSCEEAEQIEKEILDKIDQLPRVLLPLYIVHEYMGNMAGLTSGEVSKVTTELGIRIDVANASRTLSGSASRYVIGDRVRKSGQPVRYKLSRRGHAYVKEVIGSSEGLNDLKRKTQLRGCCFIYATVVP
jgi:hypothetical protein